MRRLGQAAARLGDTRIAVLVGCAALLLLASTADQGFVRDEGYYFKAARLYHAWFERLWQNLWQGRPLQSFSDAELRHSFGYNTEHPGLVKLLMGWTWKVFHGWLGLTSNATGFRLGAMTLVAVGVSFTYLFGAGLFGRAVGLGACALLLLTPHVFYHAHLGCFDGPIMGLGVAVTYAFWRACSNRGWVVAAGLLWGLALATKHNAVFLLPTLGIAYALARRRDLRWCHGLCIRLPALPKAAVSMLLLGPVVLYIFYPYGWHAPLERLGAYYNYHLHHEHYPVDYFGTLYTAPPFPWSYPFVMSVLTIPLPLLVMGCAGWVWAARSALRAPAEERSDTPLGLWLLVVGTLVPPLIIAVPSVPIFGGTKHWMTMMPFFCLLAAAALRRALDELFKLRCAGKCAAAVALLLAGLLAWETARTHPYGHTYYNELAGGHAGGARLGMPRTFWGGDARALLPVLNTRARQGARVFTHRMNADAFRAYRDDGLLRSDLVPVGDVAAADWALVNHQREYQQAEYDVWARLGHVRPVASVAFDGVPIVSLYDLSQAR